MCYHLSPSSQFKFISILNENTYVPTQIPIRTSTLFARRKKNKNKTMCAIIIINQKGLPVTFFSHDNNNPEQKKNKQ